MNGSNERRKGLRAFLREEGGFTLVELIVVIAILGILAGVGGVAYAGYVQKANEAVDQTLYQDILYAGALGSYANPGVTGSVTVTTSGAYAEGADAETKGIIEQWMANAFGSDWPDTVKYRTAAYANGIYGRIPLPGQTVNLTAEQQEKLNAYKQSNFSDDEVELIDRINQLAQALSSKGSDGLADKIATVETLTKNKDFSNYLAGLGLSLDNEEDFTAIGNAAVKYVAEKAAGMSTDEALNSMDNLLELSKIIKGESSGTVNLEGVDVISSAALAYGIATGYLNSDYATAEEKAAAADINVGGLSSLLEYVGTASESENFDKYYAAEGAQDVSGYLGVLSLINDYGGGVDITQEGVYGSDSTLAILQGILNGG